MKKRIFATVALLATMALVGCGGKKCDKHKFGSWETIKEATCTVAGQKQHKCTVCGYVEKQDIAAAHSWGSWEDDPEHPSTCINAGKQIRECSKCHQKEQQDAPLAEHTWNDGVASGNCGEAGTITYTCSVCSQTKQETSGYIQHSWVKTGSVEASDGGLAYDLVQCSKCNKNGLMVMVKNEDGTNNMTVTGTPKTSPTGTVKLGATDDYIQGVIKLDAAKTGKLFMRGSMDYWYTSNNQNEQKGIFNGKSGGGADMENNKANFKMEVGPSADALEEVTITCDHSLLYKDFLPEEPGFTGVADTDWSQIGDVEIGNVSLQAGLNTLRFTRTDSYNMAIAGFVIAFDA